MIILHQKTKENNSLFTEKQEGYTYIHLLRQLRFFANLKLKQCNVKSRLSLIDEIYQTPNKTLSAKQIYSSYHHE